MARRRDERNPARPQPRDALAASGSRELYLTRVVDALCEIKPKSEDESFIYLDPKLGGGKGAKAKAAASVSPPAGRVPYTEAVVFMLGGGCYAEYQNLLEAAAAKTAAGTSRSVIYGSTEMFNAEGFLTQLAKLVLQALDGGTLGLAAAGCS